MDDDIYANEPRPASADLNDATIRSALPIGWVTLGAWALHKYTAVDLTQDEVAMLAPVILPAGYAVVYRILRELEGRFPVIGRVIFGVSRTPTY